MKVRAFKIRYDTDGMDGVARALPKELTFDVDDPDFDPAEGLADLISDKTGWSIFGCEFEVLVPNPPPPSQIERTVTLKYRWWREGGIRPAHVEALEEEATQRSKEMMGQGFTSGELYANVLVDAKDTDGGVEYRGWWEVEKS